MDWRTYELALALYFHLKTKFSVIMVGSGHTGFDLVIKLKNGQQLYGVNAKFRTSGLLSVYEYNMKKQLGWLSKLKQTSTGYTKKPKMMVVSNKKLWPASAKICKRLGIEFMLVTEDDVIKCLKELK